MTLVSVMTVTLQLSPIIRSEPSSEIAAVTLTIPQAAAQTGKTIRQIRYMIQQGSLKARKVQGRWLIDSEDLKRSEPQQAAKERKQRQLRGLVDDALEVPGELPRRYSVLDLKAFETIPMQGLPGPSRPTSPARPFQ